MECKLRGSLRDWSGGGSATGAPEHKDWPEVLQMIGQGALLTGAFAVIVGAHGVYQAGKEIIKYWAKERIVSAFYTEEQKIERRIAELDRMIDRKQGQLGNVVDWRSNDASGEVRDEIEILKREKDEMETRLEAVRNAKDEVEELPTDDDEKSVNGAPGAHAVYR
jgi:chaperonin cofactor prefoldin